MEISASAVKDLREKTGAGFMDCKKALAEAKGDLDPSQTDPAALEFMSVAFTDLPSTLARNLEFEDRSKFFERRVWTPHGIADKDVAAFEQIVNEQGQHFLETLDDWLTARETEARKSHEEVVRVGVATYMFQREREPE